MNIVVVGTGYVGLSNAILLAQHYSVIAIDVVAERVRMINARKSPIVDSGIERYLSKQLDLTASVDSELAYLNADYVLIATPTDYNPEKNEFDTATVQSVVDQVIAVNPTAIIIIKSTIPVGFVESQRARTKSQNIIFSPEFLREGTALRDNQYPSRIIIGEKSIRAKTIASMFLKSVLKKDTKVIYTNPTEAEAIKLFANTYLAMRVAYFNELDTYAETKDLDAKDIIEGVGADDRIGTHYNNPSFGYGGYCLPKDTKQLLANFDGVDNALIGAIVESNDLRKRFIVNSILNRQPRTVGVYKLAMKAGSDNFRSAAILDIVDELNARGVDLVIYEPTLNDESNFGGFRIENDLSSFKSYCDCIIANRFDHDIYDVADKVYTRDLFGLN